MVTRQKAREAVRIGGKEIGRVLITGASAGIGAELAREFARHGHRLTLVARRREALAALAAELEREHQVDVQVIAQDLAKPGGPAAAVKAAQAGGEEIGILVNNAGVIDVGRFADAQPEKLIGLVDLNVRTMTEMTSRLLPGMVARGVGRVLNVSSLSAFQPVPTMAAYAASKAYVLSLTEALSEELRGTGVKVTALCPGFTETPMISEIQAGSAAVRGLPKQFLSDPSDVAAQGYRALMSGQTVVVPGLPNQLTAAWAQVTPRWVTRYIAGVATRRTV
ncbi:SDR family NAD(P)-dependent oxidoreductase [Ottowia sp.]|uniref:SDR family NAD(P)-dependent oxidoreductase n=1 Tax=Ottowia sp. TaxID=1898956 RepID=UPI0025F02C3A|nr:SDR family NAD(P)-dependent oxidoreductase [Ottowia sp.]MBK6746476.1 SDR family NAD(P)-dependent oxidoreductase [Ottowia sp.]